MTPQERKVFELALEALEEAWYHVGTFQPTEKAIDLYDEARTAIKEALAQPEDKKCENCGEFGECCQDAQPDQDEVDIRSRLYQRIHELETQLARGEQEPIGYVSEGAAERLTTVKQAHEQIRSFRLFTHDVPLYTTPPQRPWVGLTDEDRAEILNRKWWNFEDEFDVDGFLRLAEAKLKDKNI